MVERRSKTCTIGLRAHVLRIALSFSFTYRSVVHARVRQCEIQRHPSGSVGESPAENRCKHAVQGKGAAGVSMEYMYDKKKETGAANRCACQASGHLFAEIFLQHASRPRHREARPPRASSSSLWPLFTRTKSLPLPSPCGRARTTARVNMFWWLLRSFALFTAAGYRSPRSEESVPGTRLWKKSSPSGFMFLQLAKSSPRNPPRVVFGSRFFFTTY